MSGEKLSGHEPFPFFSNSKALQSNLQNKQSAEDRCVHMLFEQCLPLRVMEKLFRWEEGKHIVIQVFAFEMQGEQLNWQSFGLNDLCLLLLGL